MGKTFKLIFCLFIFQITQSQNYNSVDSIVINYPSKFNSISSLAEQINKDFHNNLDKIRASYFWISNNINYDYASYRSGDNAYKPIQSKSDESYQNSLLRMQYKYAEQCLKKRLAVCEGYSQLLKFTLKELDIECEVITGYAKTSYREIGVIRNVENHAWNAVKIDNEWKLIDATWSAGSDERNPKAFNFTDVYFFIKPEYLILSHRPKNDKWQLLNASVSKEKFFLKPIFYFPYFNSELRISNFQSGLIKVKKGGIIKLTFDKAQTDIIYHYDLQQDKYSNVFTVEAEKDFYTADILFPYDRNSVLTIYDNDQSIMEFKIIVEK